MNHADTKTDTNIHRYVYINTHTQIVSKNDY